MSSANRQKTVHTIAFHLSTLRSREVVANNKAPSTNKRMRENEIENESKKETEGNEKEMERREYALIRIKVLLLV